MPPRYAVVWLLCAAAVLFAQQLGQWHRVAHPPLWQAGHPSVAPRAVEGSQHGHAAAAHPGHPATDGGDTPWLERLFGGDGHAASCVIYDQLAHADGLPSLPIAFLPPAWVPAIPPWQARWALAAQATGFLARGPPPIG